MTHITDEDRAALKSALESEQVRLEQELAARGSKSEDTQDWQGKSSDFEAEPEEADPVDAADKVEELVNNSAVVEDLEGMQKNVARALESMDAGTYGICEVCGKEIPIERLKANPAARTCIEHA